jgi:hypothetical protein
MGFKLIMGHYSQKGNACVWLYNFFPEYAIIAKYYYRWE